MSVKIGSTIDVPPLLPGQIVSLPGRGEIFVRYHQHDDPNASTVLLLHGWTASSDVNFFTAYETLSQSYSIIGVDHRGHGRGLRPNRPFSLEDCADDAAAVVRSLGVKSVVAVGYSMGGPITLLLWQRHRDLVKGMVLQATSLEFSGTRKERLSWRFIVPMSRWFGRPRLLRWGIKRIIPRGHEMARYVPWLMGEMRRNDAWMIGEAATALSKFDARGFAHTVDVPTSFVITTGDRSVPPEKQAEFAAAVRATVVEFHADHMGTLDRPREYAAAMRESVDAVIQQIR